MKEIPLSKGYLAVVDDEDYGWLNSFKWTVHACNPTLYAYRMIKLDGLQRAVFMHRQILSAEHGEEVDHIDGNGLNNTRANLRRCTHSQNLYNVGRHKHNTSGFKGVGWNKKDQRWRAIIRCAGREFFLGNFKDKCEAARAYNEGAQRLHGEFARLNEI